MANTRKHPSMVGKTHGRLTVIEDISSPGSDRKLVCKCECGNTTTISAYNLRKTSSCGCLRSPNLLGMVFGRLTVIGGPFKQEKTKMTLYTCRCECGTERLFLLSRLISGNCRSCGCATYGSNHHQWKGGTEEEIALRAERRPRVAWGRHVRRLNPACACCGGTTTLAAHHVFLYGKAEVLRYEIANGLTLCNACHIKYHQKFGKAYGGIGTMGLFLQANGGDIERLFPLIDLFREDWRKDEHQRIFCTGADLGTEPGI